MARGLQDIYDSATFDLRTWAEDNPDETDPGDEIFEIADSAVPVYTADLLRCALDDLWLATTAPENGLAFDGSSTAVNSIAANLFEAIEEKLWQEWRTIEQEREQAKEDAAEELEDWLTDDDEERAE